MFLSINSSDVKQGTEQRELLLYDVRSLEGVSTRGRERTQRDEKGDVGRSSPGFGVGLGLRRNRLRYPAEDTVKELGSITPSNCYQGRLQRAHTLQFDRANTRPRSRLLGVIPTRR